MWTTPDSARGLNYVRVLSGRQDFTLDALIATAYDNYLIAFEKLLPPLSRPSTPCPPRSATRRARRPSHRCARGTGAPRSRPCPPASRLSGRTSCSAPSPACPRPKLTPSNDHLVAATTPAQKLAVLQHTVARLERDFGS